jgi:hypothetical protein
VVVVNVMVDGMPSVVLLGLRAWSGINLVAGE